MLNRRVQEERAVVVVPNNGVETNHKQQAIRLENGNSALLLFNDRRVGCCNACSSWWPDEQFVEMAALQ
jgi:hypothetical protein